MPEDVQAPEIAPNPIPETQTSPAFQDTDAELDAGLNNLFKSSEPKTPEAPKEQPKEAQKEPEKEAKVEPKQENKDPLPEGEKVKDPDFKYPKKGEKGAWDTMREINRKQEFTIKEKDEKIVKLEKALAEKGQSATKEVEELKKQVEELKGYRAIVDYQADPEFINNFEKPIETIEQGLDSLLMEFGLTKEMVDQIDYANESLVEQIEATIAEKRGKISARKFVTKVEELNNLYDKRTDSIKNYKGKYKEILDQKRNAAFNEEAEREGRLKNHLERIATKKNEKGEFEFPFLNPIQAKDPHNQAEVEQANNHNQVVQIFHKRLEEMAKMNTPEDMAELRIAALTSHWLMHNVKALMKRNEGLQKELEAISKAGSGTPKSQKTTVSHSTNGEDHGVDHALESFFTTRR